MTANFMNLNYGDFDFDQYDRNSFTMQDIAISLARTCRFGGHILPKFEHYSVADHLVIAYYIAKTDPAHDDLSSSDRDALARLALMHDAHEMITGDITTPTKNFNPMMKTAVADLEQRVDFFIDRRFPFIPRHVKTADVLNIHERVKTIDARLVMTERQILKGECARSWGDYLESLPIYGEDIQRVITQKAFDSWQYSHWNFLSIAEHFYGDGVWKTSS